MIGKLKGTIDEIGDDYVLVDVHGVCYEVFCSSRVLSKMGSVGEAVVLFIETYVREDQFKLFGFLSAGAGMVQPAAERARRRRQGGARGAVDPDAVRARQRHCPSGQDDSLACARRRAEGRGADRDRTQEQGARLCRRASGNIGLKQELGEGVAAAPVADAVSALTNLGYSRDQAANAVATALKNGGEGAIAPDLYGWG